MEMNTFLPYGSDFEATAKCLDRQRLGKQRVECKQILLALFGEKRGWREHLATEMWEGYCDALVEYGYQICSEWIIRGYNDNLIDFFLNYRVEKYELIYPPWINDPRFINSHRSRLLQKDYNHYSQFGWDVPLTLNYWWPA
jgi:hypothetical protein